jgi:hypothetical protein
MAQSTANKDQVAPKADAPDSADVGEYFDQAVFDLHYHLLAARTEGLPPVPNLEDYGVTVDRNGNVTRTGNISPAGPSTADL